MEKIILFLAVLIFNSTLYSETIEFTSANPFSFKDIIVNLIDQEKQAVFGILRLPDDDSAGKKFPLIIGVAGSEGWADHHYEYLEMYRKMGIATFELKSFSSRGITSTVGTQIDVTMAMMILDSYKALDILSTHSKIDKQNIAITGWSLGGGVSLFSGWKKIIKAIGSENRFSAHLPIYPPCMIRVDKLEFTDVPMHILIGELDDWTPSSACQQLVSTLKKTGHKIDITIYDDSHHSFDSHNSKEIVDHGYSFKDCMFDISDDGSVLMNYLNIPMTSPLLQKIGLSFCVERGPTVAGNSRAKKEAHEFSKLFMSQHLLGIK